MSIDTEGYKSLGEAAGDAEAEESGRLVYVAASRAERRLILSGVYDDSDLEASEKPRRSRTALGCLLPALGVDGEDGQRIRMPAPEAREGLDHDGSFQDPEAVVRVIGPGAESAARLARDRRERTETPPAEEVVSAPPAALDEAEAAAARSLSYVALAGYERCGYRFLTERVLGLGADEPAAVPGTAPTGGSMTTSQLDANGTSVPGARRGAPGRRSKRRDDGASGPHGIRPRRPRAARVERAQRLGPPRRGHPGGGACARGADAGADARLTEMLEGWLSSPLLKKLRGSGVVLRPEVGFRLTLEEGTILRGTLDLLGGPDADGAITVVDYKTDRLGGRAPELDAGYELQRSLYAAAVAEATGRRPCAPRTSSSRSPTNRS